MTTEAHQVRLHPALFEAASRDLKKFNRRQLSFLFFFLILALVLLYSADSDLLHALHVDLLFDLVRIPFDFLRSLLPDRSLFSFIPIAAFFLLLYGGLPLLPFVIAAHLDHKYESRFCKNSFPRLLADLFREYQPVTNTKPDHDFFTAFPRLNFDEPTISLVFRHETEAYRATAFLYYRSTQVKVKKKEETEYYYRIWQGLALKIRPAQYEEVESVISLMPREDSPGPEDLLAKAKDWIGGESREIVLEDPRFHETFKVISKDPIESRMVLTPSRMEAIRGYRDRVGDLSIVYEQGHISVLYHQIKLFNIGNRSERSLPQGLSASGLVRLKEKVDQALEEVSLLWDGRRKNV